MAFQSFQQFSKHPRLSVIAIYLFVRIGNKMNACCLYNIVLLLICKPLDTLLISCKNYFFSSVFSLYNVFPKMFYIIHLGVQNMQQLVIGTWQVIWHSAWFPNFWHKEEKGGKKEASYFLDPICLHMWLVHFNLLYQKDIVSYHIPVIRGSAVSCFH